MTPLARNDYNPASIAEGSSGVGDSQTIARLFFNPSGYLRAFTLFLGEIVTERIQARRTRRAGTVPRLAPRLQVRRDDAGPGATSFFGTSTSR